MLENSDRQLINRTWDQLWSSGITNPIVVSDLIGSVLLFGRVSDDRVWQELLTAADHHDSSAVAETLSRIRRAHGIDAGSEFEDPRFWRNCHILSAAMESLDPLLHGGSGPPAGNALGYSDVLGDIYEHILSKLATAGRFGQFRTPRHIVDFMVELAEPGAGELVVDPACGSGGFLVAASAYRRARGHSGSYHGIEIDRTIGRIATANLVFHDLGDAKVDIGDGLSSQNTGADVILANPPFAGSVSDAVAARFTIPTRKTELLFVEAMMNQLAPGGRAAVIVPLGVVNGLSTGALAIRRMLVEDNNLTHVIELPSGVFRPYSDVKTAILLWRREAFEDAVRMIRIDNDGFSLDQRRTPLRENDLHQAVRIVNGQESTLAHADVSLDELIGNNHNLTPSRYLPRRTTHIAPQRLAKTAVSLGDALGRLTAIHEHLAPVEALLSFDGSGCIAVAELVTPVRTLLEPDNINPDALYILLEHITTTTGEVTGLRAGDTEIRSPKFAFDEGDVLYGKLRPALRKCAVAPAPGICSTDLIPLRPVHAGTSFLLSAVLRSPQFTAEVTRLVSGANLPRVNVKELLALHVPWPSEDQVQHFEDLTRLAHELREEARTLASGIDDLETNLTAAMNSH